MKACGTTIRSGSSTVPLTVPLLMDWEKRGLPISVANASHTGPKSQFREDILVSLSSSSVHAVIHAIFQKMRPLRFPIFESEGYDPQHAFFYTARACLCG